MSKKRNTVKKKAPTRKRKTIIAREGPPPLFMFRSDSETGKSTSLASMSFEQVRKAAKSGKGREFVDHAREVFALIDLDTDALICEVRKFASMRGLLFHSNGEQELLEVNPGDVDVADWLDQYTTMLRETLIRHDRECLPLPKLTHSVYEDARRLRQHLRRKLADREAHPEKYPAFVMRKLLEARTMLEPLADFARFERASGSPAKAKAEALEILSRVRALAKEAGERLPAPDTAAIARAAQHSIQSVDRFLNMAHGALSGHRIAKDWTPIETLAEEKGNPSGKTIERWGREEPGRMLKVNNQNHVRRSEWEAHRGPVNWTRKTRKDKGQPRSPKPK